MKTATVRIQNKGQLLCVIYCSDSQYIFCVICGSPTLCRCLPVPTIPQSGSLRDLPLHLVPKITMDLEVLIAVHLLAHVAQGHLP